MTRDAKQLTDVGHGRNSVEPDLLAALWEEVPFSRLPLDAPPQLKEYLVEIENPKKLYTIHRATRRHNLQLLIDKFVQQLRYGCGSSECQTSTCFTCRKRLAGNAPIRRYSPSSARTLAIFIVSQDNPEARLCPHLPPPRGASDAVKPLMLGPNTSLKDGRASSKSPKRYAHSTQTKDKDGFSSPGRTSDRHIMRSSRPMERGEHGVTNRGESLVPTALAPSSSTTTRVAIVERSVKKDYRSFAANVFGSVAFKMLEWLSPHNLEAIFNKADRVSRADRDPSTGGSRPDAGPDIDGTPPRGTFTPSSVGPGGEPLHVSDTVGTTPQETGAVEPHQPGEPDSDGRKTSKESPIPTPLTANSSLQTRPDHSRRNSNARVRTTSITKAQTRLSTDQFADGLSDDVKSPRSTTVPQHPRFTENIATSPSSVSRSPSQCSAPEAPPETRTVEILKPNNRPSAPLKPSGRQPDGNDGVTESSDALSKLADGGAMSHGPVDPDAELDSQLPQTLSQLNVQAIEFMCDVLRADSTAENDLLTPLLVPRASRHWAWKRRRVAVDDPYPQRLKLEWKLFIEQSIFFVLSDPEAILRSFALPGLAESQTMWYCMLRLTGVARHLVLDSLWISAASLFAPPKALQRSPTGKVFPRHGRCLANEEAAYLLSVCFHALVAASPEVSSLRQLSDISRVRSRGLIFTKPDIDGKSLEYEDAFMDDMMLRLARRLLACIPTRRCFDELSQNDVDSEQSFAEADVLELLLAHLDSPFSSDEQDVDLMPSDIEVNERRVPILLLDWARRVMIDEWDGKADVPGHGPFGGALLLIAAIYQQRKRLLLSDVAFQAEYFGERLDTLETPVSWLGFSSTRQRVHLLDFPYIFSPATLVSYFRAINFSRMNRAHEEAGSLQSRISSIVAHDTLVTDPHQKNVLQDMLKKASSKYLILDIGRKTVLQDAFDQLWRREERELLRPLKIHLGEESGEEGFDSGGVQQEFFRIAIAEALNPDYGAFAVDERTRMSWFQPGSLQPEWKFELVGLLVSLAVYNGLTLPVTFPKVLYRKLLGQPVTDLHHISDGWPDLANGLTQLLEWDEKNGAVQDIFARTYEFSISMFGQPVSREMHSGPGVPSWPQFSQQPSVEPLMATNPEDVRLVTGENREEYVGDYIRYLTHVSVEAQFEAFARGFRTCLHSKSLTLLDAGLLQSVVEGTHEVHVGELRRAVRYVGWDATHPTIRQFWSIVRGYDERMRRKLLEFVTASDRVPVGGMRNIQFVIQKNGEEEGTGGHLPTAYTCYGILLLPQYSSADVLRERLAMALENAQGFGFA